MTKALPPRELSKNQICEAVDLIGQSAHRIIFDGKSYLFLGAYLLDPKKAGPEVVLTVEDFHGNRSRLFLYPHDRVIWNF